MPNPLISLRFFGGIAVERDREPLTGRAVQRRRLGLLALLATARTGQISRDKILGYLWPESDTEAARHLLAGAVYELRKALGEDTILSRGDELALNPAWIQSDLAEFEAALVRGDLEAALAWHRGPFADGLFVSNASEFERWLETTRAGYLKSYRDALERFALEREAAGDLSRAADLWERLAVLDPAEVPVVRRAMEVLNGGTNAGTAMRLSRLHASHMRREFGSEPDPGIMALADKIRRGPADQAGDSRFLRPASATGSRPRRAIGSLLLAGAAGAGFLTLVLLVTGLVRNRHSVPDQGPAPAALRVLPFTLPDSAHRGLGDQLTRLLASAVDGVAGDRGGPSATIQAGVQEISTTLRIHAEVIAPGDPAGRIVAATVTGDPAHLAETVDRLALELMARWPRPPAERLTSVAARSTRSMAALNAWMAGEREYHDGRFLAAADRFARAVAADSGFALAYYRLSLSRLAADFPEAEVAALDNRALELSEQLPERDRFLIHAYLHFRRGEAEPAEQRFLSLTSRYPDDVESWIQLGETRFHYNPLRGIPISQAREPFQRALALDPSNWIAQWHLAHLDALAGRPDLFARAMDRLLEMNPESATRLDLRALRAIASGDRAAEDRLVFELRRADELQLFQLIWRAGVYLRDLPAAERIARILADPQRPTYPRKIGLLSLAYLSAAQGDTASADSAYREVAVLLGEQSGVTASRVGLALMPDSPGNAAERRRLRDQVQAGNSADRNTLTLLGILDATLGDGGAALTLADRLEASGSRPSALLVRAEAARRAGRPAEALELLGQNSVSGWYGASLGPPLNLSAHTRFLRAEILSDLGRREEAERWYQSLREFALADLAYGPVAGTSTSR